MTSLESELLADFRSLSAEDRLVLCDILDGVNYEAWLVKNFPRAFNKPLGDRHRRLWQWLENLQRGVKCRPLIEVWPRGSGKTTSIETGVAFVATRQTRRFCLYVCATQELANTHIQSIARKLTQIGCQPKVDEFGSRAGWRRNQLQLNDFTVAGFGVEGAIRGLKVEDDRPDWVVLDDLDEETDSPDIILAKEEALIHKIFPAGSSDCVVSFVQNLIHNESIMHKLYDGSAKYLANRHKIVLEKAIEGLQTEVVQEPDSGLYYHKIIGGRATWEGQNIEVCQSQIIDWTYEGFLREAQHDVASSGGYFFNVAAWEPRGDAPAVAIVDEVPKDLSVCMAWDMAGTEGGGDFTVGVLMGRDSKGILYILHVVRGQWGSDRVREQIYEQAEVVRQNYPLDYCIHLTKDPGQAGIDQSITYTHLLDGFMVRIKPTPTKTKARRARPYAAAVNVGNIKLMRAPWNAAFISEHRAFKEEGYKGHDDTVDAATDAFLHLMAVPEMDVAERFPGDAVQEYDSGETYMPDGDIFINPWAMEDPHDESEWGAAQRFG